ncbi:YolD-like family protein [Paenibacillus sp. 1A_MP2]|uniref:YolD-like family protein n=1 Tax=Paenibacillus sp. 1A_MP2 TaxID=3457495 RepID=UPI003FCDF6EF
MSKKLVANGLWESNRIMLPQHKERINAHHAEKHYIDKPLLHEDEREIIGQNLRMSLNYTLEATLEVFNKTGSTFIKGIVTSVSNTGKRIKIELEQGYDWIDFDKLLSVRLNDGGADFETDI